MTTITVDEAQAKLPQLIGQLAPGEEVIISDGRRPAPGWWGRGGGAKAPATRQRQGDADHREGG
ncbi:hypothetical protein OJF2_37470 [Aquisphaera giovannonii]|uniref:Uncharacterized protein n=1 Tax=Aquisphaera giovannonii TaxID=406548 RepID=A0A5B9W5E9_9BACT|nr:hypothetical protein [Aquisphaera giovannonii]QEH35200.1 hypothetical protein OJF2_37470 [Aquisphaera giovannonii]